MPSTGVKLQQLDAHATRHHGLITQQTAASLGVSRSSWYRAINSGYLEQLFPSVARLHGSPSTLQQRALAAVWATGPGSMASHRTAAALWGVERPETDPIDVITPSRNRMPRLPGVVVHRPRDLVDLRAVMRHRVPTCGPTRMLLDLGAVDERAVDEAMIAILVSKVVSPKGIREALTRHSISGRSGVTPLRLALSRWLGDELPPDSLLESRMSTLILDHKLPPVQFHAIVGGYEVDFLIVGTRVVLECDGWGSHGLDRDQFEFDRARDADLLAQGFIPVHFTWRALTSSPQEVAERIRRALAQWS
jgi:very-short-patch-repair endonuclease